MANNQTSVTAQRAIDYFISEGWTRAQAAGIVANLQAESAFRPDAIGDGGQAYGIAQWHPDRQQHFEEVFGKDIRSSGLDDQLAFVQVELNRWEKAAGDALRTCSTAEEAGACISKMYERPADREGEAVKRAALAAQLFIAREDQPAAPIQEESTTIPKEPVMPSSIDSIAGLVSIINPAAGGVVGLAGKLLEMFSPKTVAKIDAQLGAKRTDVASEAATLVEQAKVLTGKSDGFDAVAAARADPTVMAKLEQTAEQRMDTLIKAADKTAGYDQSLWAAQNEGRRVVSSIAIEEHRAGLWDMTKTLVMTACAIALLGSLALLGAIIYQSVMKAIDPVLLALAGPLLTITFGAIGIILSYRFDGTKDASAQTKALISAATDKTGA